MKEQQQRSLTQKIKDKLVKHKKKKDGKEAEPGIALDTTWFFYGLGVLLVGNLIVVQYCMYAAGKGESAKGRRTL